VSHVALAEEGTLGLIATNTVAQGDSREVGLDAMVAGGFTITRAIQSRSWPASSANLEYAAVWGTLAEVASNVPTSGRRRPPYGPDQHACSNRPAEWIAVSPLG
jgi:hypothetical protein